MSVALRGNLQDFGIADVFQLIGQQRKTGVLEFTGEAGQVQLRFDRGAVVSAAPVGEWAEQALGEMLVRCGRLRRGQVDELARECEASAQTVPRLALARGWVELEELERIEDLLTRETFFEVLRWESGAFDFRAQAVEHSRRFESLLGAEQILMDGLRMVDEWHSFAEQVPSQETVFERVAGLEEYRRRTQLDTAQCEQAEAIYQLVDGRISVRRIIDLSMLGSFDAVRLLADLRRHEVISPLDEEELARLQPAARRSIEVSRQQAASWIVALLPLGLLALVVGASWRGPTAPAALPGFALHRPLEGAVAEAYAARRLRHALETHRFREGRWPQTLAELERDGLLPSGALAQQGTRPYYYVERESGALLLAPER